MKSWTKPTNEMIDNTLAALKKMTARKYFFTRLENPLWLAPLERRDYFKYPPKTLRFDDGTIQYPYWPEIQYLKNVCSHLPDEVVRILTELPDTDNPVVYDVILDIALELPGEYSIRLKDKIHEYLKMEHRLQSPKFTNLLVYWTKENQATTALEVIENLVKFRPDPQSEEKQKQREENPLDFSTTFYPSPLFDSGIYSNIMTQGVFLVADSKPYKVACLLINILTDMMYLRTHRMEYNKEADLSEIWCPRLHELDDDIKDPERVLVLTVIYSCEKVYEKSPNAITELDELLRKPHWKVFKRIRQHLYAKFPSDKTKHWIREIILERKDYDQVQFFYEFYQMIQNACQHFGEDLLTIEERLSIFSAIYSGPSKEEFRTLLGEEYTEESYQKRQEYFHRYQFTPFASVLFGKYQTHFQELEENADEPISDDNFLPYKTESGFVSICSPLSPEELGNLTDEELLTYINEWEKIDNLSKQDAFVEMNIEGLANAFQTVFKELINPDPNRLKFWMENRNQIKRPIYIRMMINAFEALIKEKKFDQLSEWLTFCEWVLSHPIREHEVEYRQGDESSENKNWSNAHRTVCDFIGVCVEKEVDIPITHCKQLAKILEILCTQYDWNLDENNPVIINRRDPLIEGINNTRSLALEKLIKFGCWLRRHEPNCDPHEVTSLLEDRISSDTSRPLTTPEYAILGMYYPTLCSFNENWAIQHKSDIFPQVHNKRQEWSAAFSTYVLYNTENRRMYEILKSEFVFALQHLPDFNHNDLNTRQPIDVFSERIFTYYLWDLFSLNGQESLLDEFYKQTENNPEIWSNLFNIIGQRLSNTGKDLEPRMVDRIKEFFEWRLEVKEPLELRNFTRWLLSECLEVEWRLKAYSRILNVCDVKEWEIYLKELCQMLHIHTDLVVECFAKLTDRIHRNIYIQTEEAKNILRAGFLSKDRVVYKNAERALNNLLGADKMEFMDLAIGREKAETEG